MVSVTRMQSFVCDLALVVKILIDKYDDKKPVTVGLKFADEKPKKQINFFPTL